MTAPIGARSTNRFLDEHLRLARRPVAVFFATWQFVYVFFSNGTPFDAPNRSETCLLA
jgi:hypothetical protein